MNSVLVLGAGMVGVTTALALQARGCQVVLIDRTEPGRETSYGNAGIIQAEAVEPYAMPRSLPELVAIALRRGNNVNWHLTALPSHFIPLFKYFRNSAPSRHQEISRIYAGLISRALADHEALIVVAGVESLVRRGGFYQAFRDPTALAHATAEAERVSREYGVASRILDGVALKQSEPNLLQTLAGAVHWTGAWSCTDPGSLVAGYADLFKSRGGSVMIGDAMTLELRGTSWSVKVASGSGRAEASQAVIALGPWSNMLIRRFGMRGAMFRKRGYHQHFHTNMGPALPFMDVSNGAVLAPMRAGLRITSGAEIALHGAAQTPVQLERAVVAARQLFAIGAPRENMPWVGDRPCMPDMLPVVGKVPRHSNLWVNFGHGHQGFTLGPTTAALLADEITGLGTGMAALAPISRV